MTVWQKYYTINGGISADIPFENPTKAEQKGLGAPGELLFNAKGNKQLVMHVKKAMQVYVFYCNMFKKEKIKLLQLTAGCGSLKQASPYKVGIRFFVLDKIQEFGFVFKETLSNKQLQIPKLPKGISSKDTTTMPKKTMTMLSKTTMTTTLKTMMTLKTTTTSSI